MFDPKRNYLTVGKGNRTFWEQDGVLYDPSTKQPVDRAVLEEPQKPATQPSLTCKICGAVRRSPVEFKEHLIAAHSNQVPELKKPDEPAPPAQSEENPDEPAPPAQSEDPGESGQNPGESGVNQMTTENVIQPPPKRGRGRGRGRAKNKRK